MQQDNITKQYNKTIQQQLKFMVQSNKYFF